MTRDRISLELIVLHATKLESPEDTRSRLQEDAEQGSEEAKQQLQELEDNDEIIGDGYEFCYESTAKLAAMKTPASIWGAVKFPVVNNTKDAFMSEYSEDLFSISEVDGDLAARVNERKIKEIEGYVAAKSKGVGVEKGVRLLVVDIQEVHFPGKVKDKIEEEIKTQMQERIQRTKAQIAEFDAQASIIKARAKAQARILEGQG